MITRLIWSSLAFWYWFPGEVPLTTEWAGELVAPRVGLLLLRSISESGEGSRASFRPKLGHCSALPELWIWEGSNLGDWASPESAETRGDCIADNTADRVVHLQVVLLPHSAQFPLGCNEVEFEITGVVDPTQTSEVHLIGVLRVTSIWSSDGADGIFVMGTEHVEAFGSAAGLVVVFDFLAGLGGASLGMVVALRVSLLCMHKMSHCVVWTSTSFIFASGVSPRKSRDVSASDWQMSANSYLSGLCHSMSEIQCQRLNVRDLSETQCQSRND